MCARDFRRVQWVGGLETTIDLLGIDRAANLVVIELKRSRGRRAHGVAGHSE